MKFTLETGKKGLRVQKEILDASGFPPDGPLEVHGRENAIAILKPEMTAMELVRTIQSLKDLAADLLVHLGQVCGPCQHCEDLCPYEGAVESVTLPAELLERAGIPRAAKLDVFAEDGEVSITAAAGLDLRDVPAEMVELFRQSGVCLDALDELLAREETVYGS